MDPVTKDSTEFYNAYTTGESLGDGNFSVVKACFGKSKEHKKFAVKMVKLKGSEAKMEDTRKMIQSEVNIMQKMNHANILKYLDAFFGKEELLVVLEFSQFGDLLDFIIRSKGIPELKAKIIMSNIMSAVHYLHSKKIVHRDIKPENFLMFTPDSDEQPIVKLCDFGLAVDARHVLTEVCGSPSYVAPDILRMDNYGLPVDVWSCGVVMYILLCQFPPFYAENTRRLFAKILKGDFEFLSPFWDDISETSKDLVSRMLVLQSDKRITADEILKHPWFEEMKEQTKNGESGLHNKLSLKGMAIAIRCVQRFSEPIRKPQRESAILSASFVKNCENNNCGDGK